MTPRYERIILAALALLTVLETYLFITQRIHQPYLLFIPAFNVLNILVLIIKPAAFKSPYRSIGIYYLLFTVLKMNGFGFDPLWIVDYALSFIVGAACLFIAIKLDRKSIQTAKQRMQQKRGRIFLLLVSVCLGFVYLNFALTSKELSTDTIVKISGQIAELNSHSRKGSREAEIRLKDNINTYLIDAIAFDCMDQVLFDSCIKVNGFVQLHVAASSIDNAEHPFKQYKDDATVLGIRYYEHMILEPEKTKMAYTRKYPFILTLAIGWFVLGLTNLILLVRQKNDELSN